MTTGGTEDLGSWAGSLGGSGRPPDPPPFPAALPCQLHPSPLKRSLSLVPGSPQGGGNEWPGGGTDEPAVPVPPRPPFGDHAPLSPQSSVASSGSEQTEEPAGGRNTFQEDGSGMKGGGRGPCGWPGAEGGMWGPVT